SCTRASSARSDEPRRRRPRQASNPMPLRTEHDFTLPMGFVDAEGNVHREGVMRLATAADEILPHRDPRVRENPAYLAVAVLSRVVLGLGGLPVTATGVVERMWLQDFVFLQDLYNRINETGAEPGEP